MMLMIKWEPLCHYRTVRQQHWILKNLFSRLSIYSFPLISATRCWEVGGIDGQHDTYRLSQLGFQLPGRPPYNEIGFTIFTIILWRGKINKIRFLYLTAINSPLRINYLNRNTWAFYSYVCYAYLKLKANNLVLSVYGEGFFDLRTLREPFTQTIE